MIVSIFKPTKKVVDSYRHDIKSAYDLLRPIMEDADTRSRLGLDVVAHHESVMADGSCWEQWQSDLADLCGSLRVCISNLEHLLEEDKHNAINRLLTFRELDAS